MLLGKIIQYTRGKRDLPCEIYSTGLMICERISFLRNLTMAIRMGALTEEMVFVHLRVTSATPGFHFQFYKSICVHVGTYVRERKGHPTY